MRNRIQSLGGLLGVLVVLSYVVTFAAEEPGLLVKLQEGTVVILEVQETVAGGERAEGEDVTLQVAVDVVVDSKLLIKAGTTAFGTVVNSRKAGMVGQAGQVQVSVSHTTAVDGQKVFLRGTMRKEGADKMAASVVLGVFLCPLALFMKGESGDIPSGAQVKSFVQNAVMVKVQEQ